MEDRSLQEDADKGARPGHAVRSYVLRAGRITAAQQRALTDLWPRYGVDFTPARLDLERLFARSAPRTLEIGFGNGDNLLERAAAQPERDFLGIEVHRPGVGHLLLAAAQAGVDNLRVIAHDAVEVVERLIDHGCLDEVQVLFPDPWPKKRHHKRRLVQPAFIELLADRLRPGGRLHIATDWEPYALQMAGDLRGCALLAEVPAVDAPAGTAAARRPTRFERRGARLGHSIFEFLYVRTAPD
jgi:tRNA (guanine-N7-)-methyltransferase